jgi:hypothetical protein
VQARPLINVHISTFDKSAPGSSGRASFVRAALSARPHLLSVWDRCGFK